MTNFDVLICIRTFFKNEDQFGLKKKKVGLFSYGLRCVMLYSISNTMV